MELVGAGLNGGMENGGAGAAEFSTEIRGLHLEFLNSINRRKDDEVRTIEEVHGVGIVVDTVEQVVILRRAKAVGGEGAAGGVAPGVRLRSIYSGGELGKKGEIAAGQREAIHAACVDDL